MILFDSVSKQKKELSKKQLNIYLCGPTVYDHAHLGHARSSICFDLLRRVLLALGFKLSFARNYTDIDDKILKKMQENKQSLEELTAFYISSYEEDMRALNVLEPNFKPRATYFIKEMIVLIQKLISKGFTYTLEDGIYLDTSKDKAYLSLSHRGFENNISRLENESKKHNESDFVLWKFDENFYPAPFGTGRPGWHTECVAMIESLFKEGLDIHCGGIDLLFPHHENEACQCRLALDKNLASFWLHNGFVKIDGEKMSKSLNNSFFIKDALQAFQGEVLRLYLLSSHYRAHFSYSLQDLAVAKKRLDKLYRLKKRLSLEAFKDFGAQELKEGFKSEPALNLLLNLKDDLNISAALANFDEFINESNQKLDEDSKNKALKTKLSKALEETCLILGLGFLDTNAYFQFGVSKDEIDFIEEQITLRAEAKKEKDFQKADAIRANLLSKGISLQDTPNGVVWEKNNE
ncbi:cysteine--tRNA ligase [Campylobacter sp. MIT 97-5078]|uniref:cysteine--tRNA ligase n=1 Tax=Campylobacter sp. MIT 97-5078 TaxID=1548153 RepID=UPI00051299C9|nr:cysteine--tRNA ligase [Campylobacter sp. MIT 97-5078]KGI55608.1 cysteinyl-tRNA synthetase [Campylobacter sp. MIT 97-5078]KGI57272.1 cysteinyl-tRNA synthetase [Campylobacter sp. MIT 97-5078]TQR23572.1 cysteine--tRNA ligase [Campylobacter sp. MIT 97-5078]